MPKADAKDAVKFTRMCKFWKTNECKLGADCTFAHSSSELRPSPKPCFDFVKNGFCSRGQACRFVHEVVEMKAGEKFMEVQHSTVSQPASQDGFGCTPPMVGHGPYPPTHPSFALTHVPGYVPMQHLPATGNAAAGATFLGQGHAGHPFRPPPGLELPQAPENDGDGWSRRSSLSETEGPLGPLGLELSLPRKDLDHDDATTTATQSLTSTFCLSATPSNFSEDSPKSFWL
mmetsp:Transcript_49975/g.93500  ORF Transcript_49975/g.93500 Transcript_49975/m.93500 type:complete len:231 (+) Transcript_49975:71-763(+)